MFSGETKRVSSSSGEARSGERGLSSGSYLNRYSTDSYSETDRSTDSDFDRVADWVREGIRT